MHKFYQNQVGENAISRTTMKTFGTFCVGILLLRSIQKPWTFFSQVLWYN